MARDLSNNITTEIATEEHRPIELYLVILDSNSYYLTDHDQDVSFFDEDGNPQTYTAVAISRGQVKTNIDTSIDSVSVKLDNITRVMTDYLAANELRGRRMIVWRVYEEYLTDSDDYFEVFDGLIDNPVVGEASMQVTIKSRLGTLARSVPRRMYQVHCNWEFGETECGYDKVATGVSGAEVISSSANMLRISGSTYEDLDDDYFKYGTVEFTAGNNSGETRLLTYSSGTFAATGVSGMQVGLSYGLDLTATGDTITIQQGCDKTPFMCSGTFDNLINYGGFPTIPQLLVVR